MLLAGGLVLLGACASPATPATVPTGTSPVPTTATPMTTTTVPAISLPVVTPAAPPVTTAPPPPVTTRHHTATATAPPADPLTCSASMSDPAPADYHATDVLVQTGMPGSTVTATAHYKTTDTTHTGTAGSGGTADIQFLISGATPGYRVAVDVTVTARGASATCSTSFTPVK